MTVTLTRPQDISEVSTIPFFQELRPAGGTAECPLRSSLYTLPRVPLGHLTWLAVTATAQDDGMTEAWGNLERLLFQNRENEVSARSWGQARRFQMRRQQRDTSSLSRSYMSVSVEDPICFVKLTISFIRKSRLIPSPRLTTE